MQQDRFRLPGLWQIDIGIIGKINRFISEPALDLLKIKLEDEKQKKSIRKEKKDIFIHIEKKINEDDKNHKQQLNIDDEFYKNYEVEHWAI